MNPFNCRNRSKSDDDLDEVQESEDRRRKGLKFSYFYKWMAILHKDIKVSAFLVHHLFMLQTRSRLF